MRFWFRRGKSGCHVDSGLDGGEGEQEWSKEASREAGAEATWAGGGGGSPGQGTQRAQINGVHPALFIMQIFTC